MYHSGILNLYSPSGDSGNLKIGMVVINGLEDWLMLGEPQRHCLLHVPVNSTKWEQKYPVVKQIVIRLGLSGL